MAHWSEKLAGRLEALLHDMPAGISEHDLIRHLRRNGCPEIPEIDRRDLYGLFRTHFRLFHVLYRLRDRLRQSRRGELVPDPMCIRLAAWRPGIQGVDHHDRLAAFYSDLSHLENTGPEDVARMVTGLQKRQRRTARRADALSILGLEEHASADRIKHRYRQLAMRWHPDRGGDARRFRELQEAMVVLSENSEKVKS